MTTRLLLLLAAALAASPAAGQTIKFLGFNTTNGEVVANTGASVLTFTNSVNIGASVRMLDGTNEAFEFPNDSEAEFSYAISFLNTNAAAITRTNLGLGTTNGVEFRTVKINLPDASGNSLVVTNAVGSAVSLFDNIEADELDVFQGAFGSTVVIASGGISFNTNTAAATTRTNLGLGLPALTNTSNVTMMRALAGSTNTNEPFSGNISVVGTNNTNTLVFSNGILLSQ